VIPGRLLGRVREKINFYKVIKLKAAASTMASTRPSPRTPLAATFCSDGVPVVEAGLPTGILPMAPPPPPPTTATDVIVLI